MLNLLRISVALAIVSQAYIAQGADFEAHPSLAVSEEYTDNVFETRINRRSDFITRALPGLVMSYKAPALTGDLDYVFDYRHYARNTHDDEITHALSAKATLSTLEKFLFLDVSDEYQRVSLDATRDVTQESLFLNQSDRNIVTASPYIVFHPTARIRVKSGYRFIDTRYFNSIAIDKTDHVGFVEMAGELTKRFSLTADYTFTRELTDVDNFTQHRALGGFRYEYADKSFVFGKVGNAWTRYSSGQHLNNLIWDAGITHVFDSVTGTVTTGVTYNEDPLRDVIKESFLNGSVEMRLNKGSLSFSPMYSEFVLTRTDILQTKKYGATVRGQYELTADLNASAGFTAEKYEQPLLSGYTRRLQADSALSYLVAKQLTATLAYYYTDYYSPTIFSDNRHVNRVSIEIKKIF